MSDNEITEKDWLQSVKAEASAMKPELFASVTTIFKDETLKRQNDSDENSLGRLTNAEFNDFVRRKYGYS